MKKERLYAGLCFLAVGVVFCVLSIISEDELFSSRFAGFAGGLLVPGLLSLYQYFHWSSPKNRAAYDERLEQEKINMLDERNVMLRAKSGALMYRLTIYAAVLSGLICTLAGVDKWIVWAVVGFLAIEFVGGRIAYSYLSKKM